jgi:hypothetical protein
VPGFKPYFGGEELRRACATLSGALMANSMQQARLLRVVCVCV